MKKLSQKEWVAVVTSLFVVGFFFIFGQTIVETFTGNEQQAKIMQTPKVEIQNEVFGSGAIAGAGDLVVVHYVGRFVSGEVFDSSISRNEPFQFTLGVGQVIKGWDEGVLGMREGGRRTLIIPPELGYGMNDYGPIPGGSTLIFEVELIKVEK